MITDRHELSRYGNERLDWIAAHLHRRQVSKHITNIDEINQLHVYSEHVSDVISHRSTTIPPTY